MSSKTKYLNELKKSLEARKVKQSKGKRVSDIVNYFLKLPLTPLFSISTEDEIEKANKEATKSAPGSRTEVKKAIIIRLLLNRLSSEELFKQLEDNWVAYRDISVYKSKHEKEFEELYLKVVPAYGKTGTIEGEIMRATQKIAYRWFNDGDTLREHSHVVRSAAMFLKFHVKGVQKYLKGMNVKYSTLNGPTATEYSITLYENKLYKLIDFIYEYVTKNNINEFQKSDEDFLNY